MVCCFVLHTNKGWLAQHYNPMKKIVFALFFAFASYNFSQKTNIQGHLQPLGSHQDPEGHVQEINGFLEPLTFFREFVNKSKAVLFKGACQRFKATRQWNDNFLRFINQHSNEHCPLIFLHQFLVGLSKSLLQSLL